jgi:hypothetical protein
MPDQGPNASWLLPRGGKFFFNPTVNRDADTVRWDQLRNQIVSEAKEEAGP